MADVAVRMRILHITPWFPEPDDPIHGVFIQRHIAALQLPGIENTVLHLAVHLPGENRPSFSENNTEHCHRTIPLHSWRLAEWVYLRLLKKKLREYQAREKFTHVCFHIAYPALSGYRSLISLLPEKKLIIEHWSAYHFNFHHTHKPHRLSKLFSHNIRLITVSERLGKDIAHFCDQDIRYEVVPNVVDTNLFQYRNRTETKEQHPANIQLLMHAFWKEPKIPLEVFQEIADGGLAGVSVTVSGNGPLWHRMKSFVADQKLHDRVTFIDMVSPGQIASLMQNADGFLLPTSYETFSVVTAEALCCGCPVIVSDAGALPELVSAHNGIIKRGNESWSQATERFRNRNFDRQQIAADASGKYTAKNIGQQLLNILNTL
jgi:glycosyltransferase involved in cell wall biosynthesis